MDFISNILQTTFNSFDFTYCIIVNILTYIIIKVIDDINKEKEVTTWTKRIVLLASIAFTGVVYLSIGKDTELLFNSAILAPVSWSWIFKPICAKLNIDYKQINVFD